MFEAKPRASATDGDFTLGENLFCNLCKESITIADGYYTCLDVCDYDVHRGCFGGMTEYSEQEIWCSQKHSLLKRQPGYKKLLENGGE